MKWVTFTMRPLKMGDLSCHLPPNVVCNSRNRLLVYVAKIPSLKDNGTSAKLAGVLHMFTLSVASRMVPSNTKCALTVQLPAPRPYPQLHYPRVVCW